MKVNSFCVKTHIAVVECYYKTYTNKDILFNDQKYRLLRINNVLSRYTEKNCSVRLEMNNPMTTIVWFVLVVNIYTQYKNNLNISKYLYK